MLPHLTLRPTAQITEAHGNLEQLSIVDTDAPPKATIAKEDAAAKAVAKAKWVKMVNEAKAKAEKAYAAKLANLPPAPFRVPGGRRFSELGDSRKRQPLRGSIRVPMIWFSEFGSAQTADLAVFKLPFSYKDLTLKFSPFTYFDPSTSECFRQSGAGRQALPDWVPEVEGDVRKLPMELAQKGGQSYPRRPGIYSWEAGTGGEKVRIEQHFDPVGRLSLFIYKTGPEFTPTWTAVFTPVPTQQKSPVFEPHGLEVQLLHSVYFEGDGWAYQFTRIGGLLVEEQFLATNAVPEERVLGGKKTPVRAMRVKAAHRRRSDGYEFDGDFSDVRVPFGHLWQDMGRAQPPTGRDVGSEALRSALKKGSELDPSMVDTQVPDLAPDDWVEMGGQYFQPACPYPEGTSLTYGTILYAAQELFGHGRFDQNGTLQGAGTWKGKPVQVKDGVMEIRAANVTIATAITKGPTAFAMTSRVSYTSNYYDEMRKFFQQRDRVMDMDANDRTEPTKVGGEFPDSLQMLDIFKVEYDDEIEADYQLRVDAKEYDCPGTSEQICTLTDEVWDRTDEKALEKTKNEKVLFHGTSVDVMQDIVGSVGYSYKFQGNGMCPLLPIRTQLCERRLTLSCFCRYGKGLYTAEEPGKSDEYTRNRKPGYGDVLEREKLPLPPFVEPLITPETETHKAINSGDKQMSDVRFLVVFRTALGCVAAVNRASYEKNRTLNRGETPLVLRAAKAELEGLYPGMTYTYSDEQKSLHWPSPPTDLNPVEKKFHSLFLTKFEKVDATFVERYPSRVAFLKTQQEWNFKGTKGDKPSFGEMFEKGKAFYSVTARYSEFQTFHELQAKPIAVISYFRRRATKEDGVRRDLGCADRPNLNSRLIPGSLALKVKPPLANFPWTFTKPPPPAPPPSSVLPPDYMDVEDPALL